MELGSSTDFRRHIRLSHSGTGKRESRCIKLFGRTSGRTPSHGEQRILGKLEHDGVKRTDVADVLHRFMVPTGLTLFKLRMTAHECLHVFNRVFLRCGQISRIIVRVLVFLARHHFQKRKDALFIAREDATSFRLVSLAE